MPAPVLLVALFLLVEQYWIAAGAVVLGSLITLAGGWLNSRREHASWLRDQRASRYQELALRSTQLKLLNLPVRAGQPEGDATGTPDLILLWAGVGEAGSLSEVYGRTLRAVVDAVSSVQVIGPKKVAVAAGQLQQALISGALTDTMDAVLAAEAAFLSAARDALGAR